MDILVGTYIPDSELEKELKTFFLFIIFFNYHFSNYEQKYDEINKNIYVLFVI